MRILLTGSSSFTGMWFTRAFSEAGHEVVTTMTRPDPDAYESALRRLRVEEVAHRASAVHWGVAFGDSDFVDLAGSGFEVLCHHGADVTDYKSLDFDVHRAVATNTRRLREVIESFRAGGGRALVLTGSVFEGGEGAGSDALPHFSPYGLSKSLTGEIFRYECCRADMPLGKFIISNPFGPLEEPRFTTYLMKTWLSGKTPSVRTPNYVRDNIHVELLARAYVRFIETVADTPRPFTSLSPSGYIESQGQFARRFASEIGSRLSIETPLDLVEQTEFPEPRVRIGLDPAPMSRATERQAWDALADDYKRRLMAGA